MKLAFWTIVMAGLLMVAAVLAACQTGGSEYPQSGDVGSGPGELRGTVRARSGVVLMPGTVVNVRLVDVSRSDGRSETIAEQNISNPRSVPVEFSLRYDPTRIDPRNRYEVQARVEVDGRPRWINTTARPVLTSGNPGRRGDAVEIWVEQVSTR
jgi:putative lipoprotein